MPNFRSRKIIKAEQWHPGVKLHGISGDNPEMPCACLLFGGPEKPHVHIRSSSSTFLRVLILEPGDWIEYGSDGEPEVVWPDKIFWSKYEGIYQ